MCIRTTESHNKEFYFLKSSNVYPFVSFTKCPMDI